MEWLLQIIGSNWYYKEIIELWYEVTCTLQLMEIILALVHSRYLTRMISIDHTTFTLKCTLNLRNLDPTSLNNNKRDKKLWEFYITLRGWNWESPTQFYILQGGGKGPQVQIVVKNATFTTNEWISQKLN
jgi:hypothetical protein